jgi:tetratricopeptide (TPR) repeat protein
LQADQLIALAVQYLRTGSHSQAEFALTEVLQSHPDNADAWCLLGMAQRAQGLTTQAEASFHAALRLRPDFVEARINLGNVFAGLEQWSAAVPHYRQALQLDPQHIDAHTNLGFALRGAGDFDSAVASYQAALRLHPDSSAAQAGLAAALAERDKASHPTPSEIPAASPPAGAAVELVKQGLKFASQENWSAAEDRYHQALKLEPDHFDALKCLAVALTDQGKLAEAKTVFERALAVHPEIPESHLGLAACYLQEEDYERGWREYEWRWQVPGFGALPNLPRWQGESLSGKTLLLFGEQGFGDTLQFIRYAPRLKELAARVTLACQPALAPLMSRQPYLDKVGVLGGQMSRADCDLLLPLLSAPYVLGTTASTIPSAVPYLTADPALVAKWQQELSAIDGLKIGIAWQGSRGFPLDRWRSIPLAHFAPLARSPGVQLVSLQKGFGAEQVAAVDFHLIDLSPQLDESAGPFMDTAAVLSSLDLVVTSDTAIAHLAGALGVPVWVALQFSPNWRWLVDREDSPWYPTMRLFRQTAFGDWPSVFQRMADALPALRSSLLPGKLSN